MLSIPLATIGLTHRELQLDAHGNGRIIESPALQPRDLVLDTNGSLQLVDTDVLADTVNLNITNGCAVGVTAEHNWTNDFIGQPLTQRTIAQMQQVMIRAERLRQAREDAWDTPSWATIGTCTSGSNAITINGGAVTINNCTISTDTASGIYSTSVMNWIVTNGTTVNWAKAAPPKKWLDQVQQNHRGVLIRSGRRGRQFDGSSQSEMLALQLLRKMVSQDEFRRYLRHGHIHVRSDSGLVYQIGRQDRIQVWERGTKIAALCVHLRHEHGTPPTDEVVGKLLIVECDEPDIWQRSNITWYTDKPHPIAAGKTGYRSVDFGRALDEGLARHAQLAVGG